MKIRKLRIKIRRSTRRSDIPRTEIVEMAGPAHPSCRTELNKWQLRAGLLEESQAPVSRSGIYSDFA